MSDVWRYIHCCSHLMPKAPGASMPVAQMIAEVTLAIWNVSARISQMPATSGTDARNGPEKRPTNTPGPPQRSKNLWPRGKSSG